MTYELVKADVVGYGGNSKAKQLMVDVSGAGGGISFGSECLCIHVWRGGIALHVGSDSSNNH